MRLLKQSSAAQPLMFLLVSSTDHLTGITGATPTVTLAKASGNYAGAAGAVTEVGNGVYRVAANATDTNTLGPMYLHATATGADPTDQEYAVVAFDPQDAAAIGLTRLDTTVSSRSAPGTAQTITPADTTAAIAAQTTVGTLATAAAVAAAVSSIEAVIEATITAGDFSPSQITEIANAAARTLLALPNAGPNEQGGLSTLQPKPTS